MAPPEDLESCRRLPEYTLDGFITKILGIFNTYKLHWSVLRNLSITITMSLRKRRAPTPLSRDKNYLD